MDHLLSQLTPYIRQLNPAQWSVFLCGSVFGAAIFTAIHIFHILTGRHI